MFQRPHLQIITKRIIEPRKFIQVLLGPRQIGKTTLIYQLLEKCTIPSHFATADAVEASNQTWLQQQWETARLKMDQIKAEEFLLVIDEIQKVGDWSNIVK